MQERSTNRLAYATLIDLGFDPADPEVLLEVGMEKPVDWDARDDDGVICRKLSFVLNVAHAGIGIDCRYDRVRRDHGEHGGLHVYVLALRPARNEDGRESQRIALETAVNESVSVRRRSWCSDIDHVRVFWSHRGPKDCAAIENGAYVPEPTEEEAPRATAEEVSDLCDQFDAICDALAASPDPADPAPTEAEISSPGIPLDDEDIEFILDGPLVVMDVAQDTAKHAISAA